MNINNKFYSDDVNLISSATAALWVGCAAVGVAGLRLKYPWPQAVAIPPSPVQAQIMHVQLTADPSPPPDVGPPAAPAADAAPQPPAPPQQMVAPPAPPLIAVATADPNIAFALPVEGPTHIVEAKQAIVPPAAKVATAPSQPPTAAASPSAPRRITFGEGEGVQPSPLYPREAALARQQGTVVVRLAVDEDGRVRTAQAASPCPYPLLNQAAVRAVRETWRFAAGPVRTYEVAIEFQLAQH